MPKIRIYDLARENGISNKVLVDEFHRLGIPVKSHSSNVEEADARRILASLKAKQAPKAATPAPVKTVPVKPVAEMKTSVPVKKAEPSPIKKSGPPVHKKEAPKPAPAAHKPAPVVHKPAVVRPTPAAGKPPAASRPTIKQLFDKSAKPERKSEPVKPFAGQRPKPSVKPPQKPQPGHKPKPAPVPLQPLAKKGKPLQPKVVSLPSRTSPALAPVPPPKPAVPKPLLKLSETITVKELAEKLEQKGGLVIKRLMDMGHLVSINQMLDVNIAVEVAKYFGYPVEIVGLAEEEAPLELVGAKEHLVSRPPVVTIMGHVDHGKTLLLDAIRRTNVVMSEAGGITQHIGAYKVKLGNKGEVVFLDTPGHEAFTSMRARGVKVTDIVVLVVAADDGVMPQTVEALNHARAAGVPIMVAVNKIDKPEANPDKVRQELAGHDLLPEEWGGKTIFVNVSAKKQIGLENLLEMLLLESEMLELRANPAIPARGVIIEAKLDRGRGPIATVLVQNGTLKVGDAFVCGLYSGRVKALFDDTGKKVEQAGPSTPVEVLGFEGVPQAGDTFVVVTHERKAHQIAELRRMKAREQTLAGAAKRISLEDLHKQIQEGVVKDLNVIIKADVQGSVEAVREAVLKLSADGVKINCIHGSVGGITETDVALASASNAIILGFNVRPEPKAAKEAEREGVDINLYNIIYKLTDDIKAAIEGMLEPTFVEETLGRAEVREVFRISKVGNVAGVLVAEGKITRSGQCRIIRDSVVVYEGKIASLYHFKEDVKELAAGYEGGIGVENFQDIKQGDIIEVYARKEASPKKLGQVSQQAMN